MPTLVSEPTRVSQVKSLAKRSTATLSVVVINWLKVSALNQDAMSLLLNMSGSNESMMWLCFSPPVILSSLPLNWPKWALLLLTVHQSSSEAKAGVSC